MMIYIIHIWSWGFYGGNTARRRKRRIFSAFFIHLSSSFIRWWWFCILSTCVSLYIRYSVLNAYHPTLPAMKSIPTINDRTSWYFLDNEEEAEGDFESRWCRFFSFWTFFRFFHFRQFEFHLSPLVFFLSSLSSFGSEFSSEFRWKKAESLLKFELIVVLFFCLLLNLKIPTLLLYCTCVSCSRK